MSVELTPKERKALEEDGKILEKIIKIYYVRCKTDDPYHVCDKCMKKHYHKSYIIRDADYVSPQAQEVKDIIVKLSDEGRLILGSLSQKSISYLTYLGYTVVYANDVYYIS